MTPNQPQIRLFYPIWLSKNKGKTIHAYNAHPFTRFTITDQFSAKNPPSFFPLLSTYFALSEIELSSPEFGGEVERNSFHQLSERSRNNSPPDLPAYDNITLPLGLYTIARTNTIKGSSLF